MQDSYTGDVGDFGKYGLLRALCSDDEKRKFKMGINWYLVPDMGNPGDGRFTDYVQLEECDRELYKKLSTMLNQKDKIVLSNEDNVKRLICIHIDCIGRESPELCNKRRCINKVEYLGILPADTTFYSKRLRFPKKSTIPERRIIRDAWVKEGYEKLIKCDIVFFDPDNGLQVKSVGKYSQSRNKFGIKYVFNDEVAGYYNRGQSLIIYQHRDRNPEVVYLDRIKNSINNITGREDIKSIRLRYSRGTARDFIIIPNHKHPWHLELIEARVDAMLQTAWRDHFEKHYI